MKILGIEKVHYMSKRSNQWVDGINLHCVNDPVESDKVSGQTVDRVFVSAKSAAITVAEKLQVGSEIKVFYNRFGSIDDIFDMSAKK